MWPRNDDGFSFFKLEFVKRLRREKRTLRVSRKSVSVVVLIPEKFVATLPNYLIKLNFATFPLIIRRGCYSVFVTEGGKCQVRNIAQSRLCMVT